MEFADHAQVFFSSMTTKLQDMEKKKARGVLLHINVYMGNDKFKTLKLSVFSYQMNIMNLKDTENICRFSASVSEPPFQHSYIVLL